MSVTYMTPWTTDATGWIPVCPDCHREASEYGSFNQCSDPGWSVCYRSILDVVTRQGPPPAQWREWPEWLFEERPDLAPPGYLG